MEVVNKEGTERPEYMENAWQLYAKIFFILCQAKVDSLE